MLTDINSMLFPASPPSCSPHDSGSTTPNLLVFEGTRNQEFLFTITFIAIWRSYISSMVADF